MMSDLFNHFFTVTGMCIYFLGIFSACGWHYVKCRWIKKDAAQINWSALGLIMGVSAMVFVGIQNTQLASNVRMCQKEFNSTLKARAEITADNDRLSREHRYWLSKSAQAVGDLIRLSTTPPDPNIAKLDRTDPRRVAWDAGLVSQYNLRTSRYFVEMSRIEAEQDANQKERAAHPLPEPTCGT